MSSQPIQVGLGPGLANQLNASRIRLSRENLASASPSRFLNSPLAKERSNRLIQPARPYLLRIDRISPQRLTLR